MIIGIMGALRAAGSDGCLLIRAASRTAAEQAVLPSVAKTWSASRLPKKWRMARIREITKIRNSDRGMGTEE